MLLFRKYRLTRNSIIYGSKTLCDNFNTLLYFNYEFQSDKFTPHKKFKKISFQDKLFHVHSQLLMESYLVSIPLLINMLKFSRFLYYNEVTLQGKVFFIIN